MAQAGSWGGEVHTVKGGKGQTKRLPDKPVLCTMSCCNPPKGKVKTPPAPKGQATDNVHSLSGNCECRICSLVRAKSNPGRPMPVSEGLDEVKEFFFGEEDPAVTLAAKEAEVVRLKRILVLEKELAHIEAEVDRTDATIAASQAGQYKRRALDARQARMDELKKLK